MLASLPGNPGNLVGNFYRITPGALDSNGRLVQYQGLIAPVPIPSTMVLLASGFAGMVGIGRFRKNHPSK